MHIYGPIAFVLVLLCLWSIVSPQSQWRVLQGRRYRHPDAVEPSAADYRLARILGVVAIVVIVGVGVVIANLASTP